VKKKKTVNAADYDTNLRPVSVDDSGLAWFSPSESPFTIYGFPFYETDAVYRRLPLEPKEKLPESVDVLAWNTSGGQIKFRTNSDTCAVKVTLSSISNMVHMPATGQSGFDCYIDKRFAGAAIFDLSRSEYTAEFFNYPGTGEKEITLNFPLYNGVERVLVGLEKDSVIRTTQGFSSDRPVIFYGTSITQGGCASRPGISTTNILSRKLDLPFINLGFSGSGKAEPAVAASICAIADPLAIIIDCDGNCSDVELRENVPAFFHIIRDRYPEIPILLLSCTAFVKDYFSNTAKERAWRAEFLNNLVEQEKKEGDTRIFFKDGRDLLGDAGEEGTVDGVHLNDFGFWCFAKNLTPVISRVLGRKCT
jgi:hypothetical protein